MNSPNFRGKLDVAVRSLGGSVIYTNDELFAEAHNLITDSRALHDPTAFGIRGKLYDGWETRRRRDPGSDFAIIRLAAPALIHGVTIDTAFFTGNYPPAASVHAATLLGYPSPTEVRDAEWSPLIEHTPILGDSENVIALPTGPHPATHVKLTMHPDGGIARFRVHGDILPDPRRLGGRVDLAAALNGGQISDCSNMFYSSPANVLAPGLSRQMSDGWETSRRRGEGNDWLTVRLGAPGVLHEAVIDSSRFVGNAPGWARITDAESGIELLPLTRLQPDTQHRFRLTCANVVSHVRLDIHPDGGLSRLCLNGQVAASHRDSLIRRWVALIEPDHALDSSEFFA